MAVSPKAAQPKASAHVVAANPGYFLLSFDEDAAEGGSVSRVPIVAWRIEDDLAFPITPDPSGDTFKQAILAPNGAVVVPFVAQFQNETAWQEYARDFVKELK